YDSNASSKGSLQLLARTYAGQPAGTLTIPFTDLGYAIAPDGSKVLDGEQIIAANGSTLGAIAWSIATLPTWADDSEHLCGATYEPSPGGMSMLIEFDQSGKSRSVA